MSISVTNLPNPKGQPATPSQQPADSVNQKKQIKEIQQNSKTIETLKTKLDKSISDVNKSMENVFGKSAKLVCLLRLDMVADKLDKISPRLAHRIDEIANAIELGD
jgi:hypothetical protein